MKEGGEGREMEEGERDGGRGEGWREGGGVTVAAPALALNSTT